MSAEQQTLYQELILDHGRHPRNFGHLPGFTHHHHGLNPLCGDELSFEFKVVDGIVEDVRFHGKGCAISMASASLLSQAIKGKPIEQAKALFRIFIDCLVHGKVSAGEGPALGKLVVLENVRAYPMRVKCATLACHVAAGALSSDTRSARTEGRYAGEEETVSTQGGT